MSKNEEDKLLTFSITATRAEKQRIDDAAHALRLPRATFVRRVVSDFLNLQSPALSLPVPE